MDDALRQYQRDLIQARISRRRFMTGAVVAATGAILAACTPDGGSAAPSLAISGASSGPSSTAPSAPAAIEATPAASHELEKELFLLNWSDYFSPDNKTAFTQQYGLDNFQEDTYPSNSELLARLQAAGGGQYDIAVLSAESVPTLVNGGSLQKLDKRRLPNLATISRQFRGMLYDPNDEYLVPKDWGTTGIVYRGKDVKEAVKSWRDFWHLAMTKYSGKALVVDSPGDVFTAPLRMLGFDVNTSDTAELEQARVELMKLRPHLHSIDSDRYQQTLRDEDAVLALAWGGTAYLLQQEPDFKDTGYAIPKEGTIFWTDTWVLLADAPHPNVAYSFLDWIQDPTVQVIESLYSGYASANEAAKPLLPPDFVGNPAVYVPAGDLSRLSVATDQIGNTQRADIWAEFKQG